MTATVSVAGSRSAIRSILQPQPIETWLPRPAKRSRLAPGSILRESQEGAMISIIKNSTAAAPLASQQRPLHYGLHLLLRRIPGLQRRIGTRPSPARQDTECSHDGTSPDCAACISVYFHMP